MTHSRLRAIDCGPSTIAPLPMAHGLWARGYGIWPMGDGLWAMGYGMADGLMAWADAQVPEGYGSG